MHSPLGGHSPHVSEVFRVSKLYAQEDILVDRLRDLTPKHHCQGFHHVFTVFGSSSWELGVTQQTRWSFQAPAPGSSWVCDASAQELALGTAVEGATAG